jgi:predicted nucleic acid-binding protein
MKVLVDTCVWSLLLRRQNADRISPAEQEIISELREAIQDRRAAIIGPIRQEILSGIRDSAQFARTEGLLGPFRDEEIIPGDFVEAARLFNLCRSRGVACGPVDILLCVVASRNHYGVLTSDQGLKRCIDVLRTEGRIG